MNRNQNSKYIWSLLLFDFKTFQGHSKLATLLLSRFYIGAHQLPEQQETVGSSEGLRSSLQHGVGKRERALDGGSKGGERKEEVETRQQGSIHLEDVSQRRFRHSRLAQPVGERQIMSSP